MKPTIQPDKEPESKMVPGAPPQPPLGEPEKQTVRPRLLDACQASVLQFESLYQRLVDS